jgi:dihydrolipoamide dehydrogenase
MARLICDVAVIGAGTAGLAAERRARQEGAKTLLIDDRFAGTTCATVGCMPSKLLIAAGEAAEAVRRAAVFGIGTAAPVVDGVAVLHRVRAERDHFAAATRESFDALPPGTMRRGRARFTGPSTLALDDGDGVVAKAVVIATGSQPSVPPVFEPVRSRVLTNETLFELPDLPGSVAVIGAGPLGLELAQALARLGVSVAVFDQGQRFAGLQDPDVAAVLRTMLERDFPVRLGVRLHATLDGAAVALSWDGPGAGRERFDYLLVAAGRPPALAGLGLDRAGIVCDDESVPVFDRLTMQCGGAPVFIAGDATAERPVLHEASATGTIAGWNAACYPRVRPGRRTVPFAIMFTDPPLAVIGRVDDAASVVGEASYADQGRARVEALNRGLVKLYAEPATGRLVGAVMAAPGADHMAHLIAWAIEQRQTADDVLNMPIYHPTLEEGLKSALTQICKAVGAVAPPDRDRGSMPGA